LLWTCLQLHLAFVKQPNKADAGGGFALDRFVAPGLSDDFVVRPLHLALAKQPADAKVGQPIPFQVNSLNADREPVTSGVASLDDLLLTLTAADGTTSTLSGAFFLENGNYSGTFSVPQAGTYTLRIQAGVSDGGITPTGEIDINVMPVISSKFKIT
jgi:hypothetical protein